MRVMQLRTSPQKPPETPLPGPHHSGGGPYTGGAAHASRPERPESRRDGPPRNQAGQDLETGVRLDAAPWHAPPRSARYTLPRQRTTVPAIAAREKSTGAAVMARRTILALAAGLLLMLGAAHVYLHPTLQTTAHEDDTIARLEKLHQRWPSAIVSVGDTVGSLSTSTTSETPLLLAFENTKRDALRVDLRNEWRTEAAATLSSDVLSQQEKTSRNCAASTRLPSAEHDHEHPLEEFRPCRGSFKQPGSEEAKRLVQQKSKPLTSVRN